MGQARENYLGSDDPTLQELEQVPDIFSDPHHQFALAYQYYIDAYSAFLAGSDEFHDQDQALEERYST